MMGLPYGEEIMIVGRTMWTQSTSGTDGQTDRQTDRITIPKTVQRRASHGKNASMDNASTNLLAWKTYTETGRAMLTQT